jgi:hypothetical protein
MIAKPRERNLILKNSDIQITQGYHIKVLNRFAMLQNPAESMESCEIDITRSNVWKSIHNNVKSLAGDNFGCHKP